MQITFINLAYLEKQVSKDTDTTQIGASSASLLPPTERLQSVNEQI